MSPTTPPDLLTDFAANLLAWTPQSPVLAALRREYIDYLEHGGSADREAGPQHLTASAFVFSPDLRHVLLCFHRKGQFWVQFGGHIEPGDASVAAAAAREALEESGIAGLTLSSSHPIDLDRHALGDGFGRCAVHWDIGFVAVAPRDTVPVTSAESEDVAWWPVDALPSTVPPAFPGRLARVLTELAR